MTDLSKFSDAEIRSMFDQARARSAAPSQKPDMSQMSDAQLLALYKLGPAPAPPEGAVIHENYIDAKGVNRGVSTSATNPAIHVDRTGMTPRDEAMATAAVADRARNDNFATDITRATLPLSQGLSASGGDELISGAFAGTRSLFGNDYQDSYDFAQELQRQELERERDDHPYRSMAGQIGGGIATSLGAGRFLPFPQGPMGAQMLTGMGYGATGGAVEGFLSGSGTEDRLNKARDGGIIGGMLGTAAPPLFAGARNLFNKVADKFTVDSQLAALGLSRPAADQMRRGLESDDIFTPGGRGQQNMGEAGADATLADAGQATRSIVDAGVQRGGPGASEVMQRVSDRLGRNLQQLQSTFNRSFGSMPKGMREQMTAIRDDFTGLEGLYAVGHNTPVNYAAPLGRKLEDLMPRVPPSVFREANELMQLMGKPTNRQMILDVADDGTVRGLKAMPDTMQWDYVKRALQARAEGTAGQGALGKQTPFGRAYEELGGEIRRTLGRAVPEWDKAVTEAAIPINRIKALKLGEESLPSRMSRSEFRAEYRRLPDDAKAYVGYGMREHIDETIANTRRAISNLDKEGLEQLRSTVKALTSDAAFEKLRIVLPQAEYMQVVRQLQKAERALLMNAEMAVNSRTFGRQVQQGISERLNSPGIVGSLREGTPVNATRRGVQEFFGTTPQDKLRMEDDQWSQILDFLTSQRGLSTPQTSQALRDAYDTAGRNAATATEVGRDVAIGLGAGAYQYGQQQLNPNR